MLGRKLCKKYITINESLTALAFFHLFADNTKRGKRIRQGERECRKKTHMNCSKWENGRAERVKNERIFEYFLYGILSAYIILYRIPPPGNMQVNIPINDDDDMAWHEGSYIYICMMKIQSTELWKLMRCDKRQRGQERIVGSRAVTARMINSENERWNANQFQMQLIFQQQKMEKHSNYGSLRWTLMGENKLIFRIFEMVICFCCHIVHFANNFVFFPTESTLQQFGMMNFSIEIHIVLTKNGS